MDIVLKVTGEEALRTRQYLRHAQKSKAELPALCLRVVRQAVHAQAKLELEVLQKELATSFAIVPVTEGGESEEKEGQAQG